MKNIVIALLLVVPLSAGAALAARDRAPAAPSPVLAPASGTKAAAFERFARSVETSMAEGDLTVLSQSFDLAPTLTTMARELGLPEQELPGFLSGAKGAVRFADQVRASIAGGGEYHFLRVRTIDGETRAVFRLVTPASSFNYHELFLSMADDGTVSIYDALPYTSGERLSAGFRRVLPLVLDAMGVDNPKKPRLADPAAATKLIQDLQRLPSLAQAGAHRDFEEALARLPESLQREKGLQVLRVVAARDADPETYASIMARFEESFPGDPALDLMLVDSDYLRKDWSTLLSRLDRLAKAVGGDPWLDFMAGAMHLESGDVPAARATLRRAVDAEPSNVKFRMLSLVAALRAEDWDGALAMMRVLRDDYGTAFGDISTNTLYDGFLKTKAGAAWQKEAAQAR